MIRIVPSILTNNPDEALEMFTRCEGVVERVSVDIIDGQYADNKTIDPSVFEDVDTSLKIDYQLMVKEPVNWIERCVRGGADRIIGQIEMMKSQLEFMGHVQEVGKEVGLGIDLPTPINVLDQTILNDLDVILVMSVKAGFGGQKFDPSALLRIKDLDEIRKKDDTPYVIQVDGGVDYDNISEVEKAGADEVSVGRKLFDGDLNKNIEKFLKVQHG